MYPGNEYDECRVALLPVKNAYLERNKREIPLSLWFSMMVVFFVLLDTAAYHGVTRWKIFGRLMVVPEKYLIPDIYILLN